ncbi:rab GTPase-activating protein 1-like isoform X2 [Episyrphus balteatus]|uniref:rab GTPase-activating protein 1-like isoform X2 n=1 Tax=Episyrphus balteatus TaxID=286459 RepID=UPI0024860984|nr:rab GTPase-activating protein 1-like isoform X2 [Episyrphus balteatus]
MDDNISTNSSSDSISTSGEYEIVVDNPMNTKSSNINNKSPTLDIPNNGDFHDLKNDMTEAIRELEQTDLIVSKCDYELLNDLCVDRTTEAMALCQLNNGRNSMEVKACILDAINDENAVNNNIMMNESGLVQDTASCNATKLAQKSLTLPLAGTSKSTNIPVATQLGTQTLGRHGGPLSPKSNISTPDVNKVGHSVFYDCIDGSPAGGEKQDDMKPEKSDTDEEDIDQQGCTIFSGVTYLGAANINAPKSEIDIHRIMCELNTGSNSVGLKVSVSIPNCSDGLVMLYDADNNSLISSYEVQTIILYFRGPVDSTERGCFAFTWLHGESLFQCHVFRCHIPEAVNQVSACFTKAFRRYPASLTCSVTSAVDSIMINSITSDISGNPISAAGYEFIVSLEIREKVAKAYCAVPRGDRSSFKLRCKTDKEVCITVKQTASSTLQPLFIERCFGVLLSPGKLVRQADMQLLDMVSMGYQVANVDNQTPLTLNPYQIRAEWKASDKAFEQLNYESNKTFLTVAVDLVIRGIQEPVRFVIETPVIIQSQTEIRIMDHFTSKRPMSLRFYLHLKKTDEASWEVASIDPSEEILEQTPQSSLLKFGINNLSRMVRSSSVVSIEDDCPTDYSSDGDEPLLSGTGEVSKECSQYTLDEWDPILKEWDTEKRPKNLAPLVRLGVPEALRGKIWQKLSNVEGKIEMTDMYRTLITEKTKCETVIQRDIHRTFPAHKCFKETGGSGQDALFKVSKAYAVYDSEVGYCQGLSFIAASLLLHMPEEDSFCVLVSLMYDYRLRDLYKQGFESLYLRLFQLDRLIREHLPKLHEHFERCGVETHMYASQWFLTLFTARFPLCFVFHVLDVFLLDGIPLLFQVAITLLSICEAELRQLDFEGILKYFRVTLPKKCRSSSQARKIMKMACERKVKKLKQYEDEFFLQKKNEERIEKEAQIYEAKFGEERKKLQAEIALLQKKLDDSTEKGIQTEKTHTGITHDYKQIIQRQEEEITRLNEVVDGMSATITKCSVCSENVQKNSSLKNVLKPQKKQPDEPALGPLDPINIATQRIRELELELAQAKLAQVEAECKNQDLNHQLNATLSEIQNNRSSWQPWLSKTFNSIQEKVTTRRDAPTFQSYTNPGPDEGSNQDRRASSLVMEQSPKMPSKFQHVLSRNSIDILPRERPILRDNLSFNNLK